jgi:hypothetical protein
MIEAGLHFSGDSSAELWLSFDRHFPRRVARQCHKSGEGLLDHISGSPAFDSAECGYSMANRLKVVAHPIPTIAGEAHLLALVREVDRDTSIIRHFLPGVGDSITSQRDVGGKNRKPPAKQPDLLQEMIAGEREVHVEFASLRRTVAGLPEGPRQGESFGHEASKTCG